MKRRSAVLIGISLAFACALGVTSRPASALDQLTPTDLSALSTDNIKDMIDLVALGTNHRAYTSASNLGSFGFDIGLDVVAINTPAGAAAALQLATGQPSGNIPSLIPLPKINVHKGLPGKFDVGFTWLSYQDVFSTFGFDVKKTLLSGLVGPALAVRGSYTSSTLYFISSHNYALDLIVSKNLYVIDPYIGTGLQFWSGDLNVPAGVPLPPSGVDTHQGGTNAHFFGGVAFKLVILHLTAEMDYNTAGLTSYGGKVSIAF